MIKKRTTKHHPYPQGGMPSEGGRERQFPTPAPDKSWIPGRPGQGGEGLSDGYGGSLGNGTGPSGPQTDGERTRPKRRP